MWNDFEDEEEEMFEHGSKNARQIVKRFLSFLKYADDFFTENELEYLFSYFYYHKSSAEGHEHTVVQMGLERYPHSGFFQACRAKLLMDAENHDLAIPFLKEALILDPGNYDSILMLIDCYEVAEAFDKALELIDYYLEDESDIYSDLLLRQANLLLETKQEHKAIVALSKLILVDLENDMFALSIYITFEEKDVLKAIDLLIDADPYNDKIWEYKGTYCLEMNQVEQAQNAYEYAHYIDPNNEEYAYRLGECCKDLQQYSKAIEFYTAALKLTSDPAPIAIPLAICYNRIACYEKARQLLQSYSYEDLPDYLVQYEMGYSFFFDNQPNKALPFLTSSIEMNPNLESYILLGESYYALDQHNQIPVVFQKALLLDLKSDIEYCLTAFAGLAYRSSNAQMLSLIHATLKQNIEEGTEEINALLRDIVEALLYKLENYNQEFQNMLMACFAENLEESLHILRSIDIHLIDEPQIINLRELF